jgi:hypothetical protein
MFRSYDLVHATGCKQPSLRYSLLEIQNMNFGLYMSVVINAIKIDVLYSYRNVSPLNFDVSTSEQGEDASNEYLNNGRKIIRS